MQAAYKEELRAWDRRHLEELRTFDAAQPTAAHGGAAGRARGGAAGRARGGGGGGGGGGGELGGSEDDADAADAAWASLWSEYGPLGAPTLPSTAEADVLSESHPEWAADWAAVLEKLKQAGGPAAGGAAAADAVPPAARRDCGFPGITEAECVKRPGCLWDETVVNVPWCFF